MLGIARAPVIILDDASQLSADGTRVDHGAGVVCSRQPVGAGPTAGGDGLFWWRGQQAPAIPPSSRSRRDRFRVMPLLDGTPVRLHGFVLDQEVVAFPPMELVTLMRPATGAFFSPARCNPCRTSATSSQRPNAPWQRPSRRTPLPRSICHRRQPHRRGIPAHRLQRPAHLSHRSSASRPEGWTSTGEPPRQGRPIAEARHRRPAGNRDVRTMADVHRLRGSHRGGRPRARDDCGPLERTAARGNRCRSQRRQTHAVAFSTRMAPKSRSCR